jgi:hypothetical protein
VQHYGVEFSPDSSKLYFSTLLAESSVNTISLITQFDLSSYNPTDIASSSIELVRSMRPVIGALQLALDEKIYVALDGESYLAAINEPNMSGLASNYQENAVDLNGQESTYGLPPFIQSFFLVGIQAENFCSGSNTNFSVNSSEAIVSILWDFGDGTTSTEERPEHTYVAGGTKPRLRFLQEISLAVLPKIIITLI